MCSVFPLSEEVIGQLIYAMEDQRHRFLVHLETGALAAAEEAAGGEGGTHVPLPEWGPLEGFHLMERFLLTLRNPLHRERLRAALASGRGVFRSFKDALKDSPELERLWFAFKEREMRKVIRDWYDDQRELLGLARLGPEPEPTEELILEDFAIGPAAAEQREALEALDRSAFAERFPGMDPARLAACYRRERAALPGLLEEGGCLLVAQTPRGDLAGLAWGVEESEPADAGPRVRLVQLAVVPALRGLGLGGLLLDRFLSQARAQGAVEARVSLSEVALELHGLFAGRGFAVVAETLGRHLSGSGGEPGG